MKKKEGSKLFAPEEIVNTVYKYGTGHPVPDGAQHVYSRTEVVMGTTLVWHYFLVQVPKDQTGG